MSELRERTEESTEGFMVEELKLQGFGVASPNAMQGLGELLDRLGPVTVELMRVGGEQVLGHIPSTTGGSFDDPDRDTVALTQSIVDLLAEAFRVSLENCGESIIVGLVKRHHGVDFEMDLDPTQLIDHG